MLIAESLSYIGVMEHGKNKGEFVQMFQSHIGAAVQEPWCMSFVQFCIAKIDTLCAFFDSTRSKIFQSEHCLTVWNNTDQSLKRDKPEPGFVVIWRHGASSSGHTGIVVKVKEDKILTVEGNTNVAGSREGDGVYLKERNKNFNGDLNLVGFIDPWG